MARSELNVLPMQSRTGQNTRIKGKGQEAWGARVFASYFVELLGNDEAPWIRTWLRLSGALCVVIILGSCDIYIYIYIKALGIYAHNLSV